MSWKRLAPDRFEEPLPIQARKLAVIPIATIAVKRSAADDGIGTLHLQAGVSRKELLQAFWRGTGISTNWHLS